MSLTLAQLGNVMEHGTTHAGRNHNVVIPPRPFMVPAIQTHRTEISNLSAELLTKVVHGEMDKKTALGKIGAYGQGLVQKQIRETLRPENAESTIREKGSSHPLIDTGQMMQNVQWEYDTE
jgi:hypothetical protein